MQKLSKFILFFFLVVSLHTTYYLSHITPVCAQDQEAFPGIGFPCDETNKPGPDFHSLRPYQGAACGDANKASFCSNELKFVESFDLTDRCPANGRTGDYWCPVNYTVPEHDLYIELTDAMFPIMGNTEEVRNSQDGDEEYSDARKVNEYASWYLSGVNNRAEYGESTDDRVVNYSGPMQKLLPKLIQEAERIETINKATLVGDSYTDDDSGETVTEPQNHDQIVVCEERNVAVPCPTGEELRLSDWNEDLSFIRSAISSAVGTGLSAITGGLLGSLLNNASDSTGVDVNLPLGWNKRTPPLPWDNGTAEPGEPREPFESEMLYKKAYNEWLGKTCLILPAIGLQCFDNPFITNKWADLYQYIPLSNTTDKKGAQTRFDVRIHESVGTIIPQDSESYDETAKRKSAPLYFAHTQEVKESSELLNKTYVPQGYDIEKLPETTEDLKAAVVDPATGNACTAVNVRTNKGDDLFPGDRVEGDTEEMVVLDLTYKISAVLCKIEMKTECPLNILTGIRTCVDVPYPNCHAEANVIIVTDIRVPNVNEIFSTTVADSGSTFRKIFPRVEEGAPVTCIADIPAVSDVTYDGRTTLNQGETVFKVEKKPADSSNGATELTFPHVGSVYEYFLKGIQTALRPQGFGEPIYDGVLCSDLDGGDCSFDMAKVNSGISKAAAKYHVPAELLRAIFEWESGPYIANPSSYQCMTENSAGAIGVGQFKKETVDRLLTCAGEKMTSDIGMCGDYGKQLSRCSIEDSFELMARYLLLLSGKLNNCQATGTMSMSNKEEWWAAVCGYHGGFEATGSDATVLMNYQNSIPANERPVGRNMTYCDAICHRIGHCPSYPAIPGGTTGGGNNPR